MSHSNTGMMKRSRKAAADIIIILETSVVSILVLDATLLGVPIACTLLCRNLALYLIMQHHPRK